jgi:DNA-binding CsgD family transcriptional regulator
MRRASPAGWLAKGGKKWGNSPPSRQRFFEAITLRRAQILRGLADDRTEREIAVALDLSLSSVRSHVEDLKRITGLPTVREIARFWRVNRTCWVRFIAQQGGAT